MYTDLHDIYRLCDQGVQTDMIYFDFSMAFDSVSHSLLLHKLKYYGFSGNIHSWFQRVVREGINSDWLPVTSGVPKGSNFGPIVFILYSDDLGFSLSPGTSIALYAHDAKIFLTYLFPWILPHSTDWSSATGKMEQILEAQFQHGQVEINRSHN